MLDTDWLTQPQEVAHLLRWAREFARKRQAAGQGVWFSGVEGGYVRVRAVYALAVLAEQWHDDGLAEIRLSDDVPEVSYNGGDWQRWPVFALEGANWRQDWLQALAGHASQHVWLLPERPDDAFLLQCKNEYVKAAGTQMMPQWWVVLIPGAEGFGAL